MQEEKYDIITARAFAPLNKILQFSQRFLIKNSKLILHKGKKFQEEIIEAKKQFQFKFEIKNTDKLTGDSFTNSGITPGLNIIGVAATI